MDITMPASDTRSVEPMNTLAELDPETALLIVDILKAEGITCETRAKKDEIGLDVVEIVVADDQYEKACEVTEKWYTAEAERKTQRRCPACNSVNLKHVENPQYKTMSTKIAGGHCCEDCGHIIVPRT